MPTPTLNDLKAFAAVSAHRSFRKAADELGLSASSLSHVVRTLEQNLGVALLNRSTRSVAPTEPGERLLARLGPTCMTYRRRWTSRFPENSRAALFASMPTKPRGANTADRCSDFP
jgi:DNA-binding transcriptional LysR family regulator